jgi:hypothetical protein
MLLLSLLFKPHRSPQIHQRRSPRRHTAKKVSKLLRAPQRTSPSLAKLFRQAATATNTGCSPLPSHKLIPLSENSAETAFQRELRRRGLRPDGTKDPDFKGPKIATEEGRTGKPDPPPPFAKTPDQLEKSRLLNSEGLEVWQQIQVSLVPCIAILLLRWISSTVGQNTVLA